MFDFALFLPSLINRAAARIVRRFQVELVGFHLTLKEFRVLSALLDRPPQRMSDLAALTDIDRTTLSRMVTRLVEVGLVRRSREGVDAREVLIESSESGRALTQSILPRATYYERVALTGFSEEDAHLLKALLHRLYVNLERL